MKAIHHFFFEEKNTEGIALFRIVWMSLVLVSYFFDITNIQDFYSPEALVSMSTLKNQFSFNHVNIFHMFRPSLGVTYFLFVIYGLSIFTSLVGLYTRQSLILAFVLMTSFHQRHIWYLGSSELLMRTVTFYLIFSPCGHTLSVDKILSRTYSQFKKSENWPIWCLRLIQIQISFIYLSTVWNKAHGDTWLNGTAVYYASRLVELQKFSFPFFMDSMSFLKLATWGTLFIEAFVGVFVWSKRFRKTAIILGIILHLSIELMMNIPFFEWMMIALLINFISPEELKSFVTSIKDFRIRPLEVQHETNH